MKIATWNVDRPNDSTTGQRARAEKICQTLAESKQGFEEPKADILVLTETNLIVEPGKEYTPLSSDPLPVPGKYNYKHGENVATIWSKYPLRRILTRNPNSSVCARVQTPHGELIVYGTVIGILGYQKATFIPALKEQMEDWNR